MPAFLRNSVTTLFVIVALTAAAQTAPVEWRDQNIYQILTDRFYDGDPSNNNADGNYAPRDPRGVHGGDFRGLEQKLDYIKALGATAIWISPIVLNARGEYHGYAARDFYRVDPHWGTLADLQHFVRAAHERGLLVIDDIIVNHGGDLIHSTASGYGHFTNPPAGYPLSFRNPAKQYAPPFDLNTTNRVLEDLFHNNGVIKNYENPSEVELGELAGLDDFKTESPYVRAQMTAIYEYWIKEAGFDGFRVDTVKHVDQGFWREWCPAIHAYAAARGRPNFFMIGEVYDWSEAKCGSYTGTKSGGPFELDSVVDYPLYFIINNVFAKATGDTRQIENHYAAVAENYDASAQSRLVTFLDNHDQPRFLGTRNASNQVARLDVALVFLYTARGIPCLYYGTEQDFNGGNDPYDREDMFAGQFESGPSKGDNFNETHPRFQLIAKLNNFRRLYASLRIGEHVNQWFTPDKPGLFAYSRRLGKEEIFVVFNTSTNAQTLPGRTTIYAPGTKLLNLLNTNETIEALASSETPPITVPGTEAKMFIARSLQRPLDPVVVSVSPAHDAAGVPASSPIEIHFSEPMDTKSVEGAFSMEPATAGMFAWSAAGDILTFTPKGTGWTSGSRVTVRIGPSARNATRGGEMFAWYETEFAAEAKD